MTDFNLSAAISLQLATSAGTKLAEDINKAVNAANIQNVSVKITPVLSGMTAQLKRMFPESAATPAKVKISLSVNNPKEAKKIEDLLKEDRSIKIDVEFSDKAKKAIDDFSTSLSKLRESSKGFEELQKLVKYMNDVGKVDLENLGPSEGKLKSRAAKVKREYDDLIATFEKLAKEAKTGEFVPFSVKAFAEMKKVFQDTAVQAERFGAINGKAAKNATFAIEAVFKAYKDLDIIQKRTEKSGLGKFDPRISKAIEKAQEDAIGLLSTFDAIEQIPLAASLSALSAPIKDAVREAGQYRSLLRAIKKEGAEAVATGASDQVVSSLRERIRLTREARDNNVPINTFKESDGFIDNIGQTKNYNNVQRAALKASMTIEKFKSEADLSAEFNTQGAAFAGMKNRLNDLTKDFEAYYKVQEASGDPKAATNITEGLARLGIGVKDLKAEIKDFDTVLKNFDDKKAFFDEKGLTQSAAMVEKAKLQFIELQKTQAQGRINTSNNFFQQTNQQIEAFAENEKKLAKFISTLDRLKASLNFSLGGGEDFSGVGVGLDNLQKKVEGSLGNFDERKIKDTIASDSYMLRAKEKQNKVINAAISSFEQAAADSADAGPGRATLGPVAFAGKGEELNKFIRTLNLTSNSYKDIGKNIDIVKSKANELYALASIEADGGFIGSITKSLGLAAKRLTTFLFAARAIYGVQNAIIEATGSAVELDTEFTRLEQIFAGSQERIGSVEKNIQSLSSEILTLASNYGVAATEIAKSADIFAQAGIQGRSLQKILEISTKASVGPTFGSNIEISEAVIASMNQFRISADQMEDVIGGISQVSAQFAVESDGITKAIRRAGGAFAAAKADGQSYLGALGDFVGAFTVLKEQTREADETLATSLRNVLNRLQRSNVRKYLKETFDIDLLDNGQFIGFAESIEKVSSKIKELGIKSGDPRFAELVQKLAGSLQSSRLTSLLAGAGDIVKAVAEFQRGGESLDRDAAIAFNSLENKLTRAKSAVIDLMTTIARSDALKTMIELFVVLTQTVTGAVKAFAELGGAFGFIVKGLALFGAAKSLLNIGPKLATRALSGLTQSGILGPARGFNTGGLVPGIGPNIDTEPYMLTKGEYVINRHSVQKYGKSFFNDLNSGKINYAATGSGPNGLISSVREKGGNAIAGFVNGIFNKLDKLLGGGQENLIPDGAISDLEKIMKEFGFGVKDLGKYVSEFGFGSPIQGAAGAYSASSKRIDIAPDILDDKEQAKFIVPHEVGHALYNKDVAKSIPQSVKNFTADRMAQSPIYKGADKQHIEEEQFADSIVKLISRRKMDPEVQSWMPDAAEFDAFESALKGAGIELQYFHIEAKKAVAAQKEIGEMDLSSVFNDVNNDIKNAPLAQQVQSVQTPKKETDILKRIKQQEWLAEANRVTNAGDIRLAETVFPRSKDKKADLKKVYESHQSHIGRGREMGVLGEDAYKTLSRIKFTNKKALDDVDITPFFQDPLGVDPKYLPRARANKSKQQVSPVGQPPAGITLPSSINQQPTQPPLSIIDKIRKQQALLGNNGDPNKIYNQTSRDDKKDLRRNFRQIKSEDYKKFANDEIDYGQYRESRKNIKFTNKKSSSIVGMMMSGGGSGSTPNGGGAGSNSSGGGGGSPPTTLLSGSSIFEKLFQNAGKLSLVFGAVTTVLGYYANSSKEASEKVKIMSDAAIAAALAITTFTVASNSASSIGSGIKSYFSGGKGGAAGVATDTTKGFGGGGFFDKYGVNKPTLPSTVDVPLKGVKGFVGRVGSGVGRFGGAINGGVGQVGSSIAKLTPTFAKLGSGVLTAAKFLGPQVLGAAVVGLVAAMGSFNDAAIKASEEIIANSTSEREVIEERANIDKRQRTGRGLGVLGKVAGGAAIGAVGGPVGAALGAVAGFFLGIATEFKDTGTYEVISKAFKSVYDFFAGVATVISDGIGFVAGALDTAFVAAATAIGVGPDLQKLKEKKDRQANLDKAGANLNSFNRGAKRTGGVTQEEFDNLLKSVKQTSAATSGFKSLDDADKEKVKGQAERLKSSLDGANDFQKGSIINAAKKAGIDIKQMFQDVGLEFDEIGPQAAIASDKLSKMFAEMQSVTDRVGAIITNFNIGNEEITNKAAGIAGEGTTGGVSSGVFDQLRKGGTPTGEAAIQTNQLFADLEKFSPAAALNAQLERAGAGAAFGVSNKLAGQDIKLAAGKGGDEVRTIISDMFFDAAKAGGGSLEVRDRLDDMLDDYLDSQQEALNGAVGNGQVSNEKVTDIISGFTDSIRRGGIDTAEAFNASNQQFKQAMDGIIKRRIEYEGKITDLAKSNVDRQRALTEFQNKAAGKSDPDITLEQARGLDSQKRGIALRGTGLGGDASVADLSKRYNELTAEDPGGKDPQVQAFKQSIYSELQNIANGTDSFTTAIKEFDKAAEKAKMRTEQLSDALLGSDENLLNTTKGILLQQRVMAAGDKGQAFLALQNTDDASKQALQARLNADPEAKRAFETKLGIAPNLVASPQAAAVAGEFGTQTDAGNALITINQNLSDQMGGLAGELVKNRASFEQFGLQINNFANAANNLANNLGNIPQNIAHSHTFTVEPIQISLTGAEALASLDGPLKGVITNIVNAQIGQFANNLKSKNKGLTVDALTGNTATA